jgi:hypothetical protein
MDFSAYHLTLIFVALITGVLSPLTVQIFQYLIKKKETRTESLSNYESFENENRIIDKLENVREKFNCDRVWVAEFHNGGKTYSGKSFQKFSQTYEVVRKGIAAEAHATQNMPTSLFSNFFKILNDKGYYEAKDVKNANDLVSFTMQSFWGNRGVTSCVVISIRDLVNNFVGIMCLDGVLSKLDINKEGIEELKTIASALSGYLAQKKKGIK